MALTNTTADETWPTDILCRLYQWRFENPLGIILPSVFIGLLATLQDLAARLRLINPAKFPPFGDVLGALFSDIVDGRVAAPVLATVVTWIASLAISFLMALTIGVVIGTSRTMRALLTPIIEFLRPIPSTALIPLVVLAVGANFEGALFLTTFGTLWQILPMVVRATSNIDPVSSDVARVFALTPWQRLRWLTLPSMEPFLLTALKIGASTALVLLISIELLVGISGIGREISIAYAGGNMRVMYAYVLVAALLGLALNLGLARVVEYRSALVRGNAQ
jgi:ABC-type nitrate/sulfonate/bicarbonate transport system permease component